MLPVHFSIWVNWAEESNIDLDFSSTLFFHPQQIEEIFCQVKILLSSNAVNYL
ncbi:MAG: hypothetical protein FJW63_08500 [Actinobacteria bacterium]|nr:hypothetical protein [Actinomycetota bacterium]